VPLAAVISLNRLVNIPRRVFERLPETVLCSQIIGNSALYIPNPSARPASVSIASRANVGSEGPKSRVNDEQKSLKMKTSCDVGSPCLFL
jgi:hypothetical protein